MLQEKLEAMGLPRATKSLGCLPSIGLARTRLAKDFVDHINKMENNYKALVEAQTKSADGPPSQA